MSRISNILTIATAALPLVLGAAVLSAQEAKKGPPANAIGAGSWDPKVSAEGAGSLTLDAKQTDIVRRVGLYFNELNNFRGSFVQTGADNKRLRGKFYVKKPGRFRFDYALPSRQVVLSDGKLLAIQDHDLGNEDVIELDNTPFRVLLRKDVDLLRDARITEVSEAEDVIVVALQDKSPDAPGKIKLVLVKKPVIELKEWVTTDAQGLDTRVELSDINRTDEIDANIFKRQPMMKSP